MPDDLIAPRLLTPGGMLVLGGAPGLGRPRPGRHAEAAGLQVYEADAGTLTVRTFAWVKDRFERIAERRFPRS